MSSSKIYKFSLSNDNCANFFLRLTTLIIVDQISRVEQDSAWNDASAQEVTNLEVSGENVLRFFIELRIVLGNIRWIEEVEE